MAEFRNYTMNFGPQHPAAHGVLRLVLEMDGETVVRADPHVGLLHRATEKLAESKPFNQSIGYMDRLDYMSMMCNEHAYVVAIEQLLGVEAPVRAQWIRTMFDELTRFSNHLLWLGSSALDLGAMTVFLHTFTEREKVHNLCEALTGARFTTSYTRIGGMSRDLPPGWTEQCRQFCREVVVAIAEVDQLLTRNRIWVDRTRDVGVIDRAAAVDHGLTGPNLRGSGVNYDVRKAHPYLVYDQLEFDVPLGSVGDCYDRYLVRMEEMRQSVRLLKLRRGPMLPKARWQRRRVP